jgi:hypothetical protein
MPGVRRAGDRRGRQTCREPQNQMIRPALTAERTAALPQLMLARARPVRLQVPGALSRVSGRR